ncbi:uncharacterized protein [Watersipora subatra]|uniref:uncharacterized protein n=1 Tax=Watersipora subatra TaxID=2589382 RepID=UPI00355C90D1
MAASQPFYSHENYTDRESIWNSTADHRLFPEEPSFNRSKTGYDRGSRGSGRPTWLSEEGDGQVYAAVKYMNLIGNPILYTLLIIGLCLAIVTASRRNIRNYSSAVYLSAMFFCDVIWVTGNYLPDYAVSVNKNLHFNDGICMYIQAFRFVGRIGTSLIIIALVLERVLMLAKPVRFAMLAKPWVALLISVCCIFLSTGISCYYMYNTEFEQRSGKCNYKNAPARGGKMATQTLIKLGILGATLIIQLLLNIVLGILILKKRQYQASNPVQSSLASARRYAEQLNRINLIAFIMSLQYMLTNIPLMIGPSIYWSYLRDNRISFGTLKLIVTSIDLFALMMVASRAFVVCWVSPKIRREAKTALTCFRDSDSMTQLAIDIRPKRDVKYSSNPDIVSRWSFHEKV